MQIHTGVFKELKPDVIKKLKQLCRKATGERLIVLPEHCVVYGKVNTKVNAKVNAKVVAMCCVSPFSPELHFENELRRNVPYIYNYMIDATHRKNKVALELMTFIKAAFASGDVVEKTSEVNLDILEGNNHAIRFFERSGFAPKGDYVKKMGDGSERTYKMYTHVMAASGV
jgi:RimJ/RimL family protein N-acetyltransferase